LAGAAAVLLATLLSGCSTVGTSDVDLADHDYRVRHPIMLSNEPETLNVPVGMNGPAMSPDVERAVREYAANYAADGTGSITIQVPTASANEVAAGETGRAIHYALVRAGVPRGNIQVAPYYVGNYEKTGTVRLAYLRVKAVSPQCGIWPETRAGNNENRQYHNFGCASQQNLAAMVENPADLIWPRPLAPANGARRADVIKNYQTTGNTGWVPAPETKLLAGGETGG
jgi:pilus assembly protein CpaD